MPRLSEAPYMKFPFEIGDNGPSLSGRREHVRELVEQVLFTNPGERVYRPDFGAGVRALVFEPGNEALAEVARQRLVASLGQALHGEVDPNSLRIDVESVEEHLNITVSYRLATVGVSEQQQFQIGGSANG